MWPENPPTLVGPRFLLRPLHDSDVALVLKACQDPVIGKFTRLPVPYLQSHAVDFLATTKRRWRDRTAAMFVIARSDLEPPHDLVGSCSVLSIDHCASEGEVGYWVAPWSRGQGAALASVQLITPWAHEVLGIRRLFMQIEDANSASVKVANSAGYQQLAGSIEWELKGTVRSLHHYEHLPLPEHGPRRA